MPLVKTEVKVSNIGSDSQPRFRITKKRRNPERIKTEDSVDTEKKSGRNESPMASRVAKLVKKF